MTKFENRFFKVLSEADEDLTDAEAFEDALDADTDPAEFDAETPDPRRHRRCGASGRLCHARRWRHRRHQPN